ncbi:MAG: thymidine phosphorylase [Bacteroidetes bacterium]|nr:thymidine phosphorylase [Bacteroidota bacterium]
MNTVELIIKKRTGKALSKEEIIFLINSYTKGKTPDYQFSALLMAILLKGMTKTETSHLTKAMLHSGKVIDLSSIKGPKVDKHSTGGVGDKTSLILAPIVAAAGVNVPMISGRGLGHTGGTLDKLESIPGFRTDLSLKEYKSVLKKCGAVLIGQTKDIAPADKLIYSLRDVTGTVESIPLITGSIMSKKLAEGIDGLVLDVKTGSGAFMRETKDAIELANSLISTAKAFNKKVIAFITDMNQPLGDYIGNWLEVYESIKILRGEQKGDLLDLSLNLSGAMIYLGGIAGSIKRGVEIAKEQINNGKAFEKFVQMVELQGGSTKFILHPEKYPKSKFITKLKSTKDGYVKGINTFQIGMAALELGAGRKTKTDKIDPKAGIVFKIKLGGKIKKGGVVAELHSQSMDKINTAKEIILNAITFSKQKTTKPKLIKRIIK